MPNAANKCTAFTHALDGLCGFKHVDVRRTCNGRTGISCLLPFLSGSFVALQVPTNKWSAYA